VTDTHAVEVKALSKSFGSLKAVQGLSFSVSTEASWLHRTQRRGEEHHAANHRRTSTLTTATHSCRQLVAGRLYGSLTDPLGTVGAVLKTGATHPGRSGRNHLRILARQAGIPMSRVNELIRDVLACGVCHTDLNHRQGGINDEFPFLLGHAGHKAKEWSWRCYAPKPQPWPDGKPNSCAGPARRTPAEMPLIRHDTQRRAEGDLGRQPRRSSVLSLTYSALEN